MLSSRGCPPSRASFSIVASPLQSLKELHAPPSDISVSCGLGSGSQTSSYRPRLSLVPVHQVSRPVVFWAAQREAWPALLDRFFKKEGGVFSPTSGGLFRCTWEVRSLPCRGRLRSARDTA